MHWLWVMLVGAAIGAFAGAIVSPERSFGWIGHILAGLVGACLGEVLIGPMGPEFAGMAVFPAVIGSLVVVLMMVTLMYWARAQ